MSEQRKGRGPLLVAVVAVLALLATVSLALANPGGSSASPSLDSSFLPAGGGCQNWCGSGSATVTFGGVTTSIAGGGCYDTGATGVDARFGDWQGVEGVSSYLQLIAFRAGGPTPAPAATSAAGGPAPSEYPASNVNGSVNGSPFVLDSNAVVTLAADGTGTFSGSDLNGQGSVSGTFTCG